MEEKRKAGTGQIVAIVILVILLIANCSYIAYDKLIVENKMKKTEKVTPKEQQEEKEDVIRPLSVAEKKIIMEQIEQYNKFLSPDYPIETMKTLDNQKKLLFAFNNLEVSNKEEIMEGNVKEIIDTYFGTNNNIKYEDIKCPNNDGNLYTYDSATRIFSKKEEHNHEGIGIYQTTNYYIDGSVTNEKEYKVDVHIIYHRYCKGTCGPVLSYYKTAREAEAGTDPIIEQQEDNVHEFTDADYNEIKENLPITTFVFNKDNNGNFGLEKVEITEK